MLTRRISQIARNVPVLLLGCCAPAYAGSYIYVWGSGQAGTTDVFMAPVTGPGTLGGWTLQTLYPSVIKESGGMTAGGYLYSFGGDNGFVTNSAFSAPIGGGGFLGAWSATTTLPAIRYQPGAVTDGAGWAYIMGGGPSNSSGSNTVWTATVASGVVGSYSTQGALPLLFSEHGSSYLGGYLFISYSQGSAVYSAPAASGVVGAWTSQAPLPLSFSTSHVMAPWCGQAALYFFGGVNSNAVYFAQPAGGTVTTWNSASPLPTQLHEHAAVCVDGYAYVLGGCVPAGCNQTADVYAAQILCGGALGSWQSTTALPLTMVEMGFAAVTGCTPVCTPYLSPTPSGTATPSSTSTPTIPIATDTPTVTPTPTLAPGTSMLQINKNLVGEGAWPLTIQFAVADDADVRISLANSAGEQVAILWSGRATRQTTYTIDWFGADALGRPLASNVYVIRFSGPRFPAFRRVGVVR